MFQGHRSLLYVLDLNLQSSTVGGGVHFQIDIPGGTNELSVLPLWVSSETGCCHLHSDLMTVRGNGGHSGKLEDGVCQSFQNVDFLPLSVAFSENHP